MLHIDHFSMRWFRFQVVQENFYINYCLIGGGPKAKKRERAPCFAWHCNYWGIMRVPPSRLFPQL